jgi:CHAT domain-containing protein
MHSSTKLHRISHEYTDPAPDKFQKLHQILIAPIADLLPEDPHAHVVFIPQGQLFLVSFAALADEN